MGAKEWMIEIKASVESMNVLEEEDNWRKHSIYRVPINLADLNRRAYKPQIVSFGPYHHGEAHLKPMEKHKRRVLIHFLKKKNIPIDAFRAALEGVLQKLMDSYEELGEEWRKDEEKFLQLMITDGCFMLEILSTTDVILDGYAPNDPIFSSHGMLYTMPYVRRDMLMIENQIPWLVLERLVAVERGEGKHEVHINRLILNFCGSNARAKHMGPGLHVLDVVRKSMLPTPHYGPTSSTQPFPSFPSFPAHPSAEEIIQPATELYEAGVRFRKSRTQSLKDVRFHNGILRLPVIVIDDTTQSTFLNLMAFERLHVGAGSEVTSYVCFMDNIIDSEQDIILLHAHGIVQNALGSDKEAAKLFNELSKDATIDPESHLDDVQRKVNVYCKKKWNKWRANLVHTYFRSPWALLSLLAAVVLLGLTVAQTVYSILQYYQ